jgi:hypothetical protein
MSYHVFQFLSHLRQREIYAPDCTDKFMPIMIYTSLSLLNGLLNGFIVQKDPLNLLGAVANPVILTNIVDQENKLLKKGGDFIFMSLVNIEEETVGKSQLPYIKTADDKLNVANPDIKLNLYIQFAAFSDDTQSIPGAYERSLQLLDQVVFFFQYKNVFTSTQYAELLNANIDKLIMEPISLTFEQLNHLWATLGAKYLPSIIYKCRMLTFREVVISPEKPLIKELLTDEKMI